MLLFNINGDDTAPVQRTPFAEKHLETRVQSWADLNPALINLGQPMLSLGREIPTHHGLFIDNLFIDGNGLIVAAEMKRGRAPRDVIAQMLDYAAYVDRLSWDELETFCRKRHGATASLSQTFAQTFGRPLTRGPKPGHRLAIVAESFDSKVRDAAVYLINGGMPLILVEFQFLQSGNHEFLQVDVVLGEGPKQASAIHEGSSPELTDGFAAWLLGSIDAKLPELAGAQGWEIDHRVGKQTVPFKSAAWPLSLGDCQFRVDLYKRETIALRLSFRETRTPGLKELLAARTPEWQPLFNGSIDHPPYPTKFITVTLERALPEMGNATQLNELIAAIGKMTEALRPVVDDYFQAGTKPHVNSSGLIALQENPR